MGKRREPLDVLTAIMLPFLAPVFLLFVFIPEELRNLWKHIKFHKKRKAFLNDFYGEKKEGKYVEGKCEFSFKEVFRGKRGRLKILGIDTTQVVPFGGPLRVHIPLLCLFIYDDCKKAGWFEKYYSHSWLKPEKSVRIAEEDIENKKPHKNFIPLLRFFPELEIIQSIFHLYSSSREDIVIKGKEAEDFLKVMLNVLSEMNGKIEKAKERLEKAGGIYNLFIGEILTKKL